MTGRRLSIIEKWASAHKVGMDEAKQPLLTQASISRYEERQDIAALMAFSGWFRGEESFKRTNASP
jgi:3-oxoacyl-[acyl-carrier protein] reductase